MKFIKDLNDYSLSTKNGCIVEVLDENFECSSSEYILCKVRSKSKVGYDLLILYSSYGDPVHCFNGIPDLSKDLLEYKIVFNKIKNRWYNVRVGITGHLESSKAYSSYQDAIDNRLPSEEYTIFLDSNPPGPSLTDLVSNDLVFGTFDEELINKSVYDREILGKELNPDKVRVIDSSGNDITNRMKEFNSLKSYLTIYDYILIDIVTAGYYFLSDRINPITNTDLIVIEESERSKSCSSDSDLIDYVKSLWMEYNQSMKGINKLNCVLVHNKFMSLYPSLEKYISDKNSLIREYAILKYRGNGEK